MEAERDDETMPVSIGVLARRVVAGLKWKNDRTRFEAAPGQCAARQKGTGGVASGVRMSEGCARGGALPTNGARAGKAPCPAIPPPLAAYGE